MKNNKTIIKYFVIGGISASLDFVFFSFLMKFTTFNYILSNTISVNLGIISSYILNTKYNFKVNIYSVRRFLSFYLIASFGLAISYFSLFVGIEFLMINEYYAKISTIIIVALFQYFFNKNITFKIKDNENK